MSKYHFRGDTIRWHVAVGCTLGEGTTSKDVSKAELAYKIHIFHIDPPLLLL